MWLSDLSIRRPHFIAMVMVAVIVVGSLFYSQMGLDLFPDVSFPVVAIQTPYPGANPPEVERSVTKVIEDAVVSLNGVDTLRSTSTDSMSLVIVQFRLDRDTKAAVDDVRARVDTIRNSLPVDARQPVILKFDPSASPILSVAVADQGGARSADQIRAVMDDVLKPRLERVPGVASVNVTGGLVREVHVDLKRDRLEALGVAPQQVAQALRGENLNVPGGRVLDGEREQTVKTSGELRSPAEMGEVLVPTVRGATARLADVADISSGAAEQRAFRRLNGQDSVVASIQKQAGTNTVAVADAVKAELGRIRRDYPRLQVVVASDQSEFTRDAVADVQVSMLLGALLAALVVFAFFRDWRNTLVTIVGLPVIVFGTFAVMHVLGMGLNMLTLMALSLSVGMLIDDAIVVRENIFRHMEAGEAPQVAAQRGTAEIALAVVAVSSTIVAVFLPIAFTGGMVGMFLRDFGLTIAIAVLLSLVEAFTLAPMLSAYFFKPVKPGAEHRRAGGVEQGFNALERGYRRLLAWALGHRWAVLSVGMGAFVASLAAVPAMGFAFQSETDQGSFDVALQMPAGTRLEDTDRAARHLEDALRRHPAVVDLFTTVGSDDGAVEKASITAKLSTKGHGITQRTIAEVRPALDEVALGGKLSVLPASSSSLAGGGNALVTALTSRPVQFTLQGSDPVALDAASRQLVEAIRQVPGATDVDRSVQPGKPSLEVVVDRARAVDLGVSSSQLGSTVRALINGERAGSFQAGDKSQDVIVRLRGEDRDEAADLARLPVVTSRGVLVPLSQVARVARSTEPTVIERQDRQRQVVVGASYQGRDLGAVIADARAAVARLQLPTGVTAKVAGRAQYTDQSVGGLGAAMGLSVLFVYMILASQFGSFIHPLTIMLALPFSIVGALLGLFALGRPLDMMGMIGLILLMGLVTKNSILLVDFANQLKRRGVPTREALLQAGPVRLRPILMTTLAMIFGMVPVAAGLGAGAELRQAMGIGVIGGLLTSTVLTLVAVPVAYSLIDDLIGLRRRRRTRGAMPVVAMPQMSEVAR